MIEQTCDNCKWRTRWATRKKYPGVKCATCTYPSKWRQFDVLLHKGRVFRASNLAPFSPCKSWRERNENRDILQTENDVNGCFLMRNSRQNREHFLCAEPPKLTKTNAK